MIVALRGKMQFSLRSLFWLVTIASVLFGCMRWLGPGLSGFVLVLVVLSSYAAMWIFAVWFLLRFACTGWSLAAITLLFVGMSASGQETIWTFLITIGLLGFWPSSLMLVLDFMPNAKRARASRQVICVILCLLCIASVIATQWPLRLSFAVSQSAMDSLADKVEAGHTLKSPKKIGLFTIRKTEVRPDGAVCLWTHPNSAGNQGFVRCSQKGSESFSLGYPGRLSLSKDWRFISED